MNLLRINLHIRSDVSPSLYESLAMLPPRPRAEFLRRIAEAGLQIERRGISSRDEPAPMAANSIVSAKTGQASDLCPDAFGDDLLKAIDKLT